MVLSGLISAFLPIFDVLSVSCNRDTNMIRQAFWLALSVALCAKALLDYNVVGRFIEYASSNCISNSLIFSNASSYFFL